MVNIQYILLSFVLALLANEINASHMSILQGTTAGHKISLKRYAMPSSQREHIIDNLQDKCKPHQLVGMRVDLSWQNGSISTNSLKPWVVKIVRFGNGDDVIIDITIYCA